MTEISDGAETYFAEKLAGHLRALNAEKVAAVLTGIAATFGIDINQWPKEISQQLEAANEIPSLNWEINKNQGLIVQFRKTYEKKPRFFRSHDAGEPMPELVFGSEEFIDALDDSGEEAASS